MFSNLGPFSVFLPIILSVHVFTPFRPSALKDPDILLLYVFKWQTFVPHQNLNGIIKISYKQSFCWNHTSSLYYDFDSFHTIWYNSRSLRTSSVNDSSSWYHLPCLGLLTEPLFIFSIYIYSFLDFVHWIWYYMILFQLKPQALLKVLWVTIFIKVYI